MNKHIFLSALMITMLFLVGLSSCDLDYLPSDEVSPEQLAQNYEGLCIMTDGNYAGLKDDMAYKGSS